jgi:hypothetical protein
LILAAPNRGKVTGIIINIHKNTNTIIELDVLDSKDIENLPNFTKRYVGKKISVTITKESKLPSNLRLGQTVELVIEYVGDEYGVLFKEFLM